MEQNFGITTLTIPAAGLDFQVPGTNFVLLQSVPQTLVQATTDDGQKTILLPGVDIARSYKRITLTCPGAIALPVKVLVYAGNNPLIANPKTEPAGTFLTVEWMQIKSTDIMTVNGKMINQGQTFRRKSITVANITGSGFDSAAAANMGQISVPLSPDNASLGTRYSFFAPVLGSLFKASVFPLVPATATQLFPVTLDTDDKLTISASIIGGLLDVSVIQTWIPYYAI